MTPQEKMELFKRLVAQANWENEGYPQYRNHWNEWQIGRVTKEGRLTTHDLPGFVPGDIVLVRPGVERHKPLVGCPDGEYRVAYLPAHPERGRDYGGLAGIAVDSIEIIG